MNIHEAIGSVKNIIPEYAKALHILRGTMHGIVCDYNGDEYNNSEEYDIWDNVSNHCAMAVWLTDTLARSLGISDSQRSSVNMAIWLHDSGKKTERMWQRDIDEGLPISEDHTYLMDTKDKPDAIRQALRDVSLMEEWENTEAGIPPIYQN
jgi:hypothetical protein